MGLKFWKKNVLCILVGIVFVLLSVNDAAPIDNDKLTIRIIHTNDMHSRFEEISQRYSNCGPNDQKQGKCYGGFARMVTLVREIRKNATDGLPTFFLNAGDTYLGSKMFTYYKWKVVARFLNILKPDVMSLGNHELDKGPEGLAPFLDNITFPVVAANMDFSKEPILQKARQLKKSIILMAKGRKIGVIGYLTPDTKFLAQTGDIIFEDEVMAIRKEAKRLKSEEDCHIIIALGHSGFEVDKRIAREIEEVDLVIGGHTNTFLYNGPKPDIETVEGSYPYTVIQLSGRKAYAVQAFAFTKYLGDMTIDFDGNGEITKISGQPILVDNSVPKAEDVENEVQNWVAAVKNWTVEVVGKTRVLLNGNVKVCRLSECNFGNFLTDAMIYWNTKLYEGDNQWTDAAAAIHQAGGIRTSISTTNDHRVTIDDIITALPYDTGIVKANLTGKTLLQALEWSVHDRINHNTTAHGGCFLQYSGIQVTYNLMKPLKSRVVSAKIRCSKCLVPTYEDIDVNATYTILMPDFIRNGGDGFQMLRNTPFQTLGVSTSEILSDYINRTSPVYSSVEGRIKFEVNSTDQNGASGSSKLYRLPISVLLSCFTIIFLLV